MKKCEIKEELKSLSERIVLLSKQIDEIDFEGVESRGGQYLIKKDFVNQKDLINKFREQMKKNKIDSYIIEGHTLSQQNVDEYTKEVYLKMLCIIMRYEGNESEEQELFIKRLIKGIGAKSSFEEYLKKSMEVDIDFFNEALNLIKEKGFKYIFTVDSVLTIYSGKNITDDQLGFITEFFDAIGMTKNEVILISEIVKMILEKDNRGYLKICKDIESVKEREKILVPFYSYAKQFVGGVKKEVKFSDFYKSDYEIENLYYLDCPRIRDVIDFGKLKWRVLDIDDDKMFLTSENAVSQKNIDNCDKIGSYRDSSIRRWLNDDFINSYFDVSEKKDYYYGTK